MRRTGGCQCGKVRFAVEGELGRASICHCRMCQKAFGSFYGPFVSVKAERLTWTRGQRKTFASSNLVNRGFCENCGTPLTYEWSEHTVELAIGAFDDPAAIPPTAQLAPEARLPWVDTLHELPFKTPDADDFAARLVSYQHPDHDT